MGKLERLKASPQGRETLEHLGYNITSLTPTPLGIPPWWQLPRIEVDEIPNNMHKIRDINTILYRVKRLENEAQHSDVSIYYTGASFKTEQCTVAIWSQKE